MNKLLGCAKQEGILEALADRSGSAGEVAKELEVSPRATYTLLSALAEMGVMAEDGDRFRLLDEHRGPLLDRSHPDYAGALVVHRFELIHKPENPHILDVGGGPGTYAEAFVAGGARVTVFDLPGVIELMKEQLAAAGISVVGGDFNEGLPEGPFDAVYLGSVSHIYGPEQNLTLIKRVARALSPGGLIAIRDFIRGVSKGATMFAVNVPVTTKSGNTYSEEQYREWLSAAAFEGIEVLPLPERDTHFILGRCT